MDENFLQSLGISKNNEKKDNNFDILGAFQNFPIIPSKPR